MGLITEMDSSAVDVCRLVARLREKMTVVELTDDQRDAFREATKGVIDRFLESAGDAGQAALDAVNKL